MADCQNRLSEEEQEREARTRYHGSGGPDSDVLWYILAAYAVLWLISSVKLLFARDTAVGAATLTFLPGFFQALQRALLGPMFYFLEKDNVLFSLLGIAAGLGTIAGMYFLMKPSAFQWKNDPDAFRKQGLKLAALGVVALCNLMPVGFAFVSGICTSPGVQFRHALPGTAGAVLEWVCRIGIAGFACWKIFQAYSAYQSGSKERNAVFGREGRRSAKGSPGRAAREILIFWGISLTGCCLACLLSYLLISPGSSLLGIIGIIILLGSFVVMLIWGIAAGQYITERQEGKLSGVFWFSILFSVILAVFPITVVLYTGGMDTGELRALMDPIVNSLSFSSSSSRMPVVRPVEYVSWLMAEYLLCTLGTFVYAWLTKCPYCGRYLARRSTREHLSHKGTEAYTVRETRRVGVTLEREDGSVTSGSTFAEAYRPDDNPYTNQDGYKRKGWLDDRIRGEETYEKKEQDYVRDTWFSKKHTTCRYCGESMRVKFYDDTETKAVGEERTETWSRER